MRGFMKKIIRLFTLCLFTLLMSGCFKSEALDNANIYVTVYPIDYIVSELYGYNSEINSIYPDGINVTEYSLSNQKIKKYSRSDLFVYDGLTDEKKIAATFVNKNKKLKIIDVSEGLDFKYGQEELWLNPTNYLMLAQNVKNGLKSYINSTILKEQIDKNYDNLKVTISEFETTLQLLKQNSKYNTLIVSKNYFNYLADYGFDVISLEENEDLTQDIVNRAKKLIKNKENKYIFVSSDEAKKEKYSDTIEELKKSGAEIKIINTMTNLTSEEREIKEDYVTLMKQNLELIKEEIYKD